MSTAGGGVGLGARVVIGTVCGFAWAGALRMYMAAINGVISTVDWTGTFVGVLLPGALIGAGLGLTTGLDGARHAALLRVIAASPLLFGIIPMLRPGALSVFLRAGTGGGAVGVALAALAGGFALGGGRRKALRIFCGVLALATAVSVAVTVPTIGQLALTTPRGAFTALFAASLVAVLCFGCAIPFRKLASVRTGAQPRQTSDSSPGAH